MAKSKPSIKGSIKGVYKYRESFGRMGDLEGVFVATRSEVADAMGKETYLGEVLGKHSEVSASVNGDTVKLLTEAVEAVDLVEKYGLANGVNPLSSEE